MPKWLPTITKGKMKFRNVYLMCEANMMHCKFIAIMRQIYFNNKLNICVKTGVCSCTACQEACSGSHAQNTAKNQGQNAASGSNSGQLNSTKQGLQNIVHGNSNGHAESQPSDEKELSETWTVGDLDGYVFIAIILFLVLMFLFWGLVIYECRSGTSSGKKIGRYLPT